MEKEFPILMITFGNHPVPKSLHLTRRLVRKSCINILEGQSYTFNISLLFIFQQWPKLLSEGVIKVTQLLYVHGLFKNDMASFKNSMFTF